KTATTQHLLMGRRGSAEIVPAASSAAVLGTISRRFFGQPIAAALLPTTGTPQLAFGSRGRLPLEVVLLCPRIYCLKDGPPFVDLGLLIDGKCLRGLLVVCRKLLTKIGEPATHRRIG